MIEAESIVSQKHRVVNFAMGSGRRTHGKTGTRAFSIWANMKTRCGNPKATRYKNYGGRGITVCDRWKNSFENFLADMGEPPEGMTLEREDTRGNYEPSNCKWATQKEQQRNRGNNHLITAESKTLCLAEWAEVQKLSRGTIKKRLARGWTPERAVTQPSNRK